MESKLNLVLPIFLITLTLQGQTTSPASKSENPNYVVIGAFASHDNATHFTAKARSMRFQAEFAINPKRELFYVYVMKTNNPVAAISEAKKLQKESSYWDTWVYNGLLGNGNASEGLPSASVGKDLNPDTGISMENVKVNDSQDIAPASDSMEGAETNRMEQENMVEESIQPAQSLEDPAPQPVKEKTIIEAGSKAFRFNVKSALKGKELSGEINMVDLIKSRKLGTYPANEIVSIKPPAVSGNVTFECEAFGYRKENKTINYDNPSISELVWEGDEGESVIDFDMIRLRKGDISIMYNVYFFNDAAIMRGESKSEVESLTEMMKENQKYRIRIHGHTNGGGAGKIINLGEDKNFFSLTGSVDGYGSSKKLSEVRAETIREYLISKGIEPDRMETKAWGGKRSLYDKNHSLAQANVRVEIEILEE